MPSKNAKIVDSSHPGRSCKTCDTGCDDCGCSEYKVCQYWKPSSLKGNSKEEILAEIQVWQVKIAAVREELDRRVKPGIDYTLSPLVVVENEMAKMLRDNPMESEKERTKWPHCPECSSSAWHKCPEKPGYYECSQCHSVMKFKMKE